MFLLQAAWLRLTGHASAPLASAIRTARLLAASIGVADVLLIAGLAYRLASHASPRQRRVVTAVTAVIAALDPVLTRYDRQDVIEPFALCAGLLTLHAAWGLRDRRALAYVSVTGLLGGLALLTNEITICLVAVPPLFALLDRNRLLFRRSLAAFGISVAFLLLFLLWAAELGLARSFADIQTAILQRIIGLVQITGLNVPGVSLASAASRSVGHYSSSYIVLLAGSAATLWCWSRRTTTNGNFLKALLTASHGVAAYIVAVGTLNEQFFVYLIPASIVGSVLVADALVVTCARRRVLALVAAGGTVLISLSAAGWVSNYTGTGDGVVLATQFIATTLPACTAVNASGDAEKYSYLTPGRTFTYFSVGAPALADGVHYFLLSPVDAIEREGDMSPALARWISGHGQRVALFPSQVYGTVQLWHLPASPYDPVADVIDVPGGVYVNTVGSRCGGYSVTDGSGGLFYSAYQARGGKELLGDPLTRPGSGPGGREQLFDGLVLAASLRGSPAVVAVPVVAMLAKDSPAAYRQARLPPVDLEARAAGRRGWLTNSAIRRTYLSGERLTDRSYAAAVRRYGEPLGPPALVPGAGVRQAFADVVLQAPRRGGRVRTVAVTPVARAAGVLHVPGRATVPQPPPPLPDPSPLGPPEPTSAEPFALTLGVALLLYGAAVAVLARRRAGATS